MLRPALIIHGGAGAASPELGAEQRAGCAAALATGWQVLAKDGSALDAVCEAVAVMEESPVFNAGVGSCLTDRGTVEMDAAVMEGGALRAGAVAGVTSVRHPVRLARLILEEGHYVLAAGAETDTWARRYGLPTCAPETLVTERQRARWHQQQPVDSRGTVGAAAVDRAGHVAAATSTGGILHKRSGRVGDSALVGAGTYADDSLGAASATGHGEAIIRVVLAYRVVTALHDGGDPTVAAQRGIAYLHQRVAGAGGVILVDPFGRLGHAYNTPHMTVGYMRPDLADYVVQV